MTRIPTVVIGAGHAGLAVSYELSRHAIDHVVLERGEVANTWRTERWDSLRLLTPNWQTQLPSMAYDGDEPDAYMTMPEVVDFIERYSKAIEAPVELDTEVESLRTKSGSFEVVTNRGDWVADCVVIATGGFNTPKLPAVAVDIPPTIASVTPLEYKRPSQLPEGGVLVVGASSSGIGIADELWRSGRPVTLAVGEHVRLPRTYRGRDIQWWMQQIGRLDERYDEIDDIVRARHVPSPQLVGTPDRSTLDLNALSARGVKLVGRLSAIKDGKALFSGSLQNVCALADLKQVRLLNEIDEWAAQNGLDGEVGPPHRPESTRVGEDPPLTLDLLDGSIRSVVWATGYMPDYSWVDIPVLDRKGEIKHDGGVVNGSPGLYRIGLNFLRRRKSSFIHGAADDAADIIEHLARYLATLAGTVRRVG